MVKRTEKCCFQEAKVIALLLEQVGRDHWTAIISLNLVHCSTPLQMTTSPVNMTSFSITSIMLAGSTDETDMI